VSFLSAKATDGLDAEIEPGFYWFTAYCLLSLLSLQFLQLTKDPPPEGARTPLPPAQDPVRAGG